ncbi:MAG: BT_3928 family protein [Bacteroidia bacterium]
MKRLFQVCKYLVGGLFIFSGFVKADDPLGFSYKLQEYFEAFGWQNFIGSINSHLHINISLWIASAIPILEMTLGIMVIIKARKVFTLWLVFLVTAFFAFLTFYTAYYNKVLECGCFGDFLPMTPWQSFGKNVVLLILIAGLAIWHKHFIPSFSIRIENSIIIIYTSCAIAFSLYCYNYLPVLDFRPYKAGTDIKRDMKGIDDDVKYYYTLKNKKTGETKEFDKFPENYQENWDYVSNRTEVLKKGVEAKIKDFNIVSLDGNDYTDSVLSIPTYNLLLISSSISDGNFSPEVTQKINDLYAECAKNHIKFICLTASGEGDISAFKEKTHAQYLFYNTDDTQLRTMIRSNPGLVMLKAGIVIAKWHYHSIPDYKSLNEQYIHK